MTAHQPLPDEFKSLFWDHNFEQVSWGEHRNFIIRRFLQHGSWEAVTWLRRRIGDAALRAWLIEHQGGKLTPRQLRFWELALDIDQQIVDRWIENEKNTLWAHRGVK